MITVYDKVRESTVWLKSGRFYAMYYTNFSNDPQPIFVMLNYIKGTHPNTGHIHNYIQAINLTYVPRGFRRLFVEQWGSILKNNNGNALLTWKMIVKKYPYLQLAIRRYFIGKGMMRYIREVKEEDYEQIVISSFSRDFSLVAWKAALKVRAGKKGNISRHNIANKSLSRNQWFKYAFAGPV
jgi:hypothetical protein